MRDSLKNLCAEFIVNRDIIKEQFPWENSYFYPICAALFLNRKKRADAEMLERCTALLKENTGVFSSFRGYSKLPMIAILALDDDPKDKLQRALSVYDELREHFCSSQYLPVASELIADAADPKTYDVIAARTRHIYKLIRSEHPFLTGEEDSVFCAMLAMSELDDESIIAETERCYEILKQEFFSSANSVQTLSFVLALIEGDVEKKCERVVSLYRALRERGCKYGRDYELATLGFAAELDAEIDELADDIAAVDGFLSDQKGYGFFGLGKVQRLMHAAMIVVADRFGERHLSEESAAVLGTVSLIASQQAALSAAMCASIAASVTAANAGSGH